nr:RsmB/NOP family class I SAM-dependent RNA methyltransferase [Pseudopontixanthobacter vadosimaris]
MLDTIVDAARNNGAPADRIVAEYFRNRRYAGSKDRRAVRELVYRAIRACGPVPRTGRAAMLRVAEMDAGLAELFDGSPHGPPAIGKREVPADGGVAPDWLLEWLELSGIAGEEAAALLERAPLDLRVNTLKAERANLDLPIAAERLPLPAALRLPAGTSVEQWDAYRDGLVEIQDHGSQIACSAMQAKPGEHILDLCAGAGGKTLALAAAMQNRGTLIASDTDRGRLSRLAPRAARADAGMVEAVLLNPGEEREALAAHLGRVDGVLVDAPCSGTGTWRRNPEARWRTDRDQLLAFADVQDRLLEIAADLVRPGGRITYITCSLLDIEGADRIAAFQGRHPDWTIIRPDLPLGREHGGGTRLTPLHDGTDGFFIACLCSP